MYYIYEIRKQINDEGSGNIILFDLPKGSGAINRDITGGILYERWISSNLIKIEQSAMGIKYRAGTWAIYF